MEFAEVRDKKILLSCLNWGMGHVSRCIGLVRKLEAQNNSVTIAGTENQLKIFKTYFPKIETILHEGYPFDFTENQSFSMSIWRQKRELYRFLKEEKKNVNSFLKEHSFDLLLSDHRYGFRSPHCFSIFLTHQVKLPLKGISKLFQFVHRHWVKKFNKVWIVDSAEKNLAGKLSKPCNIRNFEYIGLQSRFEKIEKVENLNISKIGYSVLLLSGPEVHLNYLLDYYLNHTSNSQKRLIIGSKGAICSLDNLNNEIDLVQTDNWIEIDSILYHSAEIFSFYGYSTLMDAQFLKAKFKLIPCPNQLEQMYLKEFHESNSN